MSFIEEEWEEYNQDSGLTLSEYMICGSLAGMMEHVTMFPFDTIKTHLQVQRANNANNIVNKARNPLNTIETLNNLKSLSNSNPTTTQVLTQLMKENGPFRMWRGVQSMFLGCIPAHAAYFGIYETARSFLSAALIDNNHHNNNNHSNQSDSYRMFIVDGVSGGLSVMVHDSVMVPMDVCKQRLQLGYYTGLLNCMKNIWVKEGLRAFYVSYGTTLVMNIPFHVVTVSTNEAFKRFLTRNGEGGYNILNFLLSGALAGGLAAFVTNPLDVAKTRLQTQAVAFQQPPQRPPIISPLVSKPSSFYQMKSQIKQLLIWSDSPSSPSAILNHQKRGQFGVFAKHNPLAIIQLSTPFFAATSASSSTSTSTLSPSSRRINSVHQPPHHNFHWSNIANTSSTTTTTTSLPYKGLISTLKKIMIEEGVHGLFKGVVPRLLVNAPSTAICWTTYETAKALLLNFKQH
jgi:solute carrier family 25 iron transporter 28/37